MKGVLQNIAASIALPYFLEKLEQCGLKREDLLPEMLSGGSFLATAPFGVAASQLVDFKSGIFPPRESLVVQGRRIDVAYCASAELAEAVLQTVRMNSSPLSIYIHEPYLTAAESLALGTVLMKMDSGLYRVIDARQTTVEALGEVIAEFSVPWSFLLLLSSVDPNSKDVKEIVDHSKMISVGAYDGEGFITWFHA